jgi:predicted amidohydrolase YtcJ
MPAADTIYFGGPIITVEDDQMMVEALAVADGKIARVGSRAAVEELRGPDTEMIDLAGQTLVPGLIDPHAHCSQLGILSVGANLLAPPDGTVNSVEDVVERLSEMAAGPNVELTGWVFGFGYDHALIGRHPDRDDLDRVSTEVPVCAVHQSGHLCVMNSAGLALMGYTKDTPAPEGGVIRRREDGEPNGVLEELAAIPGILRAVTPTTPEGVAFMVNKGFELVKSYGFTTAHLGREFRGPALGMAAFAEAGMLDIDAVSYIDYSNRDLIDSDPNSGEYRNHYRIGGLKLTLDGSPQGGTAWCTQPYLIPPEGQQEGYAGYPTIPDEAEVDGYVDEAFAKGWQLICHANGDAAADQLLSSIRKATEKYGPADRRPVLIHGQFVRNDQLDACAELGVIPSLFPMHTFYWGDWYDKSIGPERAQRISPTRSALDRMPIITSHSDAPIAFPNLMMVMWTTVNRVSRSGKVMGPDERLTPLEALKCITLWSAYQHFEEDRKGSLKEGKLADLAILSDNPLEIDPMDLKTITVQETIKEGRTVYQREG